MKSKELRAMRGRLWDRLEVIEADQALSSEEYCERVSKISRVLGRIELRLGAPLLEVGSCAS